MKVTGVLAELAKGVPYVTRIASHSQSKTFVDMIVTHRKTEGILARGRPVKAEVRYAVTVDGVEIHRGLNLYEALKAAGME